MLNVIHTNIRKTAMPRTGRTLDALVTGASGAGGGSVAAQGEQYWEIVTVGPDGAQLAQEDYYLRPRQELNVVSQRNLIAYGDVIAKSVDEEIEDAELPKAGYGITNFGLTAIKQGGGLLVDSNNLVYIDPSYAGGGGLDIEQLEQYLTTNGYLKLHDPATSLLMTGYVKAGAYSPILATDNLSVAVGKLEKHFDDYVTLATAQTITGAKIFTQDVISQGDIIAKSTSEAIADAELPIASKTQLGLIKVGSGFTITADGTINNAGGGGLTEVYWKDIKNKPSTFTPSSHTHTINQISNFPTYWDWNYISGKPSTFAPSYHTHTIANITDIGNASVLEASRLSNTRYFWGQPFNGQYDVDGSMSSVTNITMSGNLAVGVSSAQAKVHVNGDGMFTGDLICKSTSTAISDAELPIASASTFGLIKVGSGLKITNGVLSATGGSSGGSNVYWGSPTDDMVPLYVDDSYYELSRKKHKHAVSTNGTGNAVTSISFNKDTGGMILSKGSTFSLSGHTHGQYLTSHQTIYSLIIKQNGTTLATYTPNSGSQTVNITTSGGSSDWDGGTISNTIQKGDGYFLRGTGGAGYRLYLDYNDAESYVNSGKHFQWYSGTVKAMQVGNGYNYAETNWQTGSDIRKKNRLDNIYNVLDNMTRVDVFRYTWKHIENSNIYIGVGAQLVESIFPDVVSYNQEYDTYSVDYSAIGCIAFQGVKELYALQKQTTSEIDVLKQRIALLEAENQNLWNIINEKEAA